MSTDRTGEAARERGVGELLRDLSTEMATLVRQEMQLARAEIAEQIKPAAASAGMFGATALFAFGAFGALTACFVAALALVLDVWLAALVVALVYGVVALVLAQRGRAELGRVKTPLLSNTTQTVKEDVTWAKSQLKSGER